MPHRVNGVGVHIPRGTVAEHICIVVQESGGAIHNPERRSPYLGEFYGLGLYQADKAIAVLAKVLGGNCRGGRKKEETQKKEKTRPFAEG